MKKTLIVLTIIVLLLGAVTFVLYTGKAEGVVVFEVDPGMAPYQISWAEGIYECDTRDCALELEVGSYDFFLEKEGYYAVQSSFELGKGERKVIEVEFEIVPGLRLDEVSIGEEVFEVCYGDIIECGLGDLFELKEDEDTGYIALWEGITRRATFTKGMEEAMVFVGENDAVVWDEVSGEAYQVNFLEDARSFLFEVENLEGVMFAGDEVIIEAGGVSYWWLDDELVPFEFEGGLEVLTYFEGKVYFVGDGYVGSYDGFEYYTLLEDIEVDLDDVVMASNEMGIYVKSGGEIFSVRW